MTPDELQRHLRNLRRAQERLWLRPVDEVIDAIDTVAAAWLQPGSIWMARAVDTLPAATGFSPAMIEHGLPLHFAVLRGSALRALLDDELGDRRHLDAPLKNGSEPGSQLLAHILCGNIPGLAASAIFLSLAIKRAALAKSAAGDAIFPALLAESIASVDTWLGQAVLVAEWKGGDERYERIVFADSDVVIASGSDATIAAIVARAPRRLITHGHKISFAAISREALADESRATELAARLAYDIALWDQQGCLSPQLAYVENDSEVTMARFGELLGEALTRQAIDLPPRRLSLEEAAAVQRFRQEAQWDARPGAAWLASRDSAAWSIHIEPDSAFVPTCLNRCVRLKAIAALDELPALLAPHRAHLECVALATTTGDTRTATLALALTKAGVNRICAPGTMQTPGLEWKTGGRARVAEWL